MDNTELERENYHPSKVIAGLWIQDMGVQEFSHSTVYKSVCVWRCSLCSEQYLFFSLCPKDDARDFPAAYRAEYDVKAATAFINEHWSACKVPSPTRQAKTTIEKAPSGLTAKDARDRERLSVVSDEALLDEYHRRGMADRHVNVIHQQKRGLEGLIAMASKWVAFDTKRHSVELKVKDQCDHDPAFGAAVTKLMGSGLHVYEDVMARIDALLATEREAKAIAADVNAKKGGGNGRGTAPLVWPRPLNEHYVLDEDLLCAEENPPR